jgi:diguanylate cyclase (GGDEF)-like protein
LHSHYSLIANELQIWQIPVTLLTLLALSHLAYSYKHKCDQAESALRELNTALESSNELLDKLTNTDPLTDTLNRRGIEKFLPLDNRKAQRTGVPLIALVADCNDFKQINERFGHDGGDSVLKEVAFRLKKSARRSDRIARVSGDTFLVLLHDASLNDALLVAERITLAVANPPVVLNGTETTMSVSIGLSILPEDVTTVDQVLGFTKASLQRNKVARRNLG